MKLSDLYKKIPEIECPVGCSDCCGPVMMLRSEARAMGSSFDKDNPIAHVNEKTYTDWNKFFECEFLKDHRCTVYENRPLICRIFGTVRRGKNSCAEVLTDNEDLLDEKTEQLIMNVYAELLLKTTEKPPITFHEASHLHDKGKWIVGKLRDRKTINNVYQKKKETASE